MNLKKLIMGVSMLAVAVMLCIANAAELTSQSVAVDDTVPDVVAKVSLGEKTFGFGPVLCDGQSANVLTTTTQMRDDVYEIEFAIAFATRGGTPRSKQGMLYHTGGRLTTTCGSNSSRTYPNHSR